MVTGDVSSHSGRVEVLYQSEWGIISELNWSDENADLFCKLLGYEVGIVGHNVAPPAPQDQVLYILFSLKQ